MGEETTHTDENFKIDDVSTKEAPIGGEKKALSIVALVAGISGLVLSWTPFFGLICCLISVIIGIVALVKKQQKGMAIAGLICGGLGIPVSAIFSLLWGGAFMLFGDAGSFANNPDKYCQEHPDSLLCSENTNIEIDGKKVEVNTDNNKNSEDNKDDNNEQNISKPENNGNESEEETTKKNNGSATGWTYDYLKKVAEEKGGSIADVSQEYIDAFKNFEICLADLGFNISSWHEFENLSNNTEDISTTQAIGLLDCTKELTTATNSDGDELGL